MEQEMLCEITRQARAAAEELLDAAGLKPGDIFVVGCSSSEIVGGHIGKDSSMEAARAVLDRLMRAITGDPGLWCVTSGACAAYWKQAYPADRTLRFEKAAWLDEE